MSNPLSYPEYPLSYKEYPTQSPWKRGRNEIVHRRGAFSRVTINTMDENFASYKYVNKDLDIDTKRAALKASASVVGLVSLAGGETIFKVSGTIIDSSKNVDGTYLNAIVTSASLLGSLSDADIKIVVYLFGGRLFDGHISGYDRHYNIAIVNIQTDEPLPIAKLRLLDDSVSIDPAMIHTGGDNFQIRSSMFQLCAGEMVVANGRSTTTFEVMVAPGKFSLDDCRFRCTELMMATCRITKPGIGGPLVNRYGEVIGVNFMDELFTPFLPINVVSKCLDHFKKHGRFCRPWIGVVATNLYAAEVEDLEPLVQNSPNISKGVIVEEVMEESPADCAGLLSDDVIVQCDGNSVKGFLEFFGKIWDKAGKSVEVAVIRKGNDGLLKLNIAVQEISPDKFNSWPLPEEVTVRMDKYRK